MKGFIEVTMLNKGERSKALVSVANIKFVGTDDGTYITFECQFVKNKPWEAVGISVAESYSEVVEKIAQALA